MKRAGYWQVSLSILVAALAVPDRSACAAPEAKPTYARDVRRQENKQTSVKTLTTRTAKALRKVNDEYRYNRIGKEDKLKEVEQIAGSLEKLADPAASEHIQNMPWVVTTLGTARLSWTRRSQNRLPRATAEPATTREARGELRKGLLSASQGQGWIVEELMKLVKMAREKFGALRAGKLLDELIKKQERVKKETGALGRKTLGKERSELKPDEKAEAKQLSGEQKGLEKDLGAAVEELREVAQQLQDTDPSQANAIKEAAADIGQKQVGQMMQDAGKNISD
ncbi:MAG: hypothetical protein ACYTFI_01360, partial [Planctomycetota bacterium]